jgi:hypothetical protein
LSRRSILMNIAIGTIASATAVPTSAPEQADPIFAAIDHHRRMNADLLLLNDQENDLEERYAEAGRTVLEARKCLETDPLWIETQRQLHEQWDKRNEAEGRLLETTPTTIIGVAAMLNYAADCVRGEYQWQDGWADDDAPSASVREHGLSFETALQKHLAAALTAIDAQRS